MHEFCCILLSNITPSSSVHLTVQWRYMATKQQPCTSKPKWTVRVRQVLVQIEVAPPTTHTCRDANKGKCPRPPVKPDVGGLRAGLSWIFNQVWRERQHTVWTSVFRPLQDGASPALWPAACRCLGLSTKYRMLLIRRRLISHLWYSVIYYVGLALSQATS